MGEWNGSTSVNLGSFEKLKAKYIPKMPTGHLATTRNTMLTCLLCQGTKLNMIHRIDGTIEVIKCQHCNGRGIKFLAEGE